MRWERLKVVNGGVGPGKRWGHTCNAISGGKLVYVFGGYGPNLSHSNILHVFNSESQTWSELVVKGNPPSPRDSHTCTTINNNLFVFGGTDGRNSLKDLHVFYTSSNTWICPNVRGDAPEAREGHSAAVIGKRLFIFGGCGKSMNHSREVHYNDVYILDTVKSKENSSLNFDEVLFSESFIWKRAVTSGIPPSARDSHTCSPWKNKLIVIGGEDEHDYYLSNVHILDTDTFVWKELNTAGQLLSPRGGHLSVTFGKHILVFGGFNDDQNLYDDLYMLDVETGIWTKINPNGDGPSARFSMSGDCLDPSRKGVMFFIGGCDKNLEALDDMYYLHTELEKDDGRDERRLDKLSERMQLNTLNQEQEVPFSLSHNSHQISGRQYFHLNEYRPPVGKRTFQAKVTKNFANGFTIETIIDGKPLRGILFSTSSSANSASIVSKSADNVLLKVNEKQDSLSTSPMSTQPFTGPTSVSASKEMTHPGSSPLQEVHVRGSENPMALETNITNQAPSLTTNQVEEGRVLTGDST